MTIQELEQKLNECQKELAELKESKKEKWKPKAVESYWYKNDIGKITAATYMCSADECRVNSIPIFKTEKECERYWYFMDTVKEKSYEFSKEEWEDSSMRKYTIYYDCYSKKFMIDKLNNYKYLEPYFRTEEDAEYIINNFKEELLEYWL